MKSLEAAWGKTIVAAEYEFGKHLSKIIERGMFRDEKEIRELLKWVAKTLEGKGYKVRKTKMGWQPKYTHAIWATIEIEIPAIYQEHPWDHIVAAIGYGWEFKKFGPPVWVLRFE